MIYEQILEKKACFSAKSGQAQIVSAPYRNFTPSKKLLEHFAKNLIGTPYGQPELLNGVKAAGADLDLTFLATNNPCIGMKVDISVPRDEPLGVFGIEMNYWDIVAGAMKSIAINLKMLQHNASLYLLASRSVDNEVWPELCVNDPLGVGLMELSVPNAGGCPTNTNVTAYLLNLSDSELREYVNSL